MAAPTAILHRGEFVLEGEDHGRVESDDVIRDCGNRFKQYLVAFCYNDIGTRIHFIYCGVAHALILVVEIRFGQDPITSSRLSGLTRWQSAHRIDQADGAAMVSRQNEWSQWPVQRCLHYGQGTGGRFTVLLGTTGVVRDRREPVMEYADAILSLCATTE